MCIEHDRPYGVGRQMYIEHDRPAGCGIPLFSVCL
jgi:hypothetical protein